MRSHGWHLQNLWGWQVPDVAHVCLWAEFHCMLSHYMFRTIAQWHLVRKFAPQFLNLVPNNTGDTVASSKRGAESLLCSLRPHIRRSFFWMLLHPCTLSSSIFSGYACWMLLCVWFNHIMFSQYSPNADETEGFISKIQRKTQLENTKYCCCYFYELFFPFTFTLKKNTKKKTVLMATDDFKKVSSLPHPPCRSFQEALTWTGPWTCVCSSHWDHSQKAAAWLKDKDGQVDTWTHCYAL